MLREEGGIEEEREGGRVGGRDRVRVREGYSVNSKPPLDQNR